MRWNIPIPSDFAFTPSVCSHGFFMLAPNRWDPVAQSLSTFITLDDTASVPVVIAASNAGLTVSTPCRLNAARRLPVTAAVRRMLRLDEDLSGFHARCASSETHRMAADMRFGRLLRSGTLFEDVIKVICTCNVAWRQTVAMVAQLTTNWGIPVLGQDSTGPVRGFPTPARLASAGAAALRRQARLGYRADFVHRLAVDVAEARLDLPLLDAFERETGALEAAFRSIRGIGPYAAANLCMLVGRYDRLAVDTELVRHLRERFPRRRFTPRSIRALYEPWAPYQFLAYWFELWQGYAARHGQPEQWTPEKVGPNITRAS